MDSLFAYSWFEEQQDDMVIRIYGINEEGGTTCVIIENFTPYMYVELPDNDYEDMGKRITEVISRFTESITLTHKFKLYNYSNTKKPFLFCSFSSLKNRNNAVYSLKEETFFVRGSGTRFTPSCHEYYASAILQMASLRKIPMSGWIDFKGKKVAENDQISSCDKEYIVKWKMLTPSQKSSGVTPKILSFDIEVNSEVSSAMPDNRPDDTIFQISCVFHEKKKILLTLGENVRVEGVEVRAFPSEKDLLKGFIAILNDEKPNVLTGYNILGFDIPYLVKRCNRCFVLDDLRFAGFNKSEIAKEEMIKWSSSAYKNQEFAFINWEGILLVDLLPIVKRDFKLDNYKLQTVATHFLDAGKDPITHKDIFDAYQSNDPIKLSEVGKYCVKDSELVMRLADHLHCWVSLSEMAKVCNVDMFSMYTKGQTIKIYSQVYKHCLHENIVVDSNGYETKANEQYTGAYVFDPIPGYYENVVPLDFSSLYPSIIIAYNICYSTMVTDPGIPDTKCNVFEWEDHVGCEHDPTIIKIARLTERINVIKEELEGMRAERDNITAKTTNPGQRVCDAKKEFQKKIDKRKVDMDPFVKERQELNKGKNDKRIICAKRRYRFFKKEVHTGVIPTIIQSLLASRKRVKSEMALEKDPHQQIVLDKKQLAYKVSANSMYGAMGVRKGLLPLMPGAMCITYVGRSSIAEVADIIKNKWGGEIVYGDTDSNYVRFPAITDPTKLWDYTVRVAEEVSKEFPDPMKLEFENAIYVKFLILSKKRYMYMSADRNGKVDKKLGKKGVLLVRRDNSVFIRNTYEKIVNMIFDNKPKEHIKHELLALIRSLFEKGTIESEEYIITKAVGNSGGDDVDEEGRLGDYKVKALSDDPVARQKQLNGMTERAFYISSCPAQVQLADKMTRRGVPVDAGSRIEYVILNKSGAKTQGQKIEEFDYYQKRKYFLKIDSLYYLHSLINPFDQLLSVVVGETNFVEKQYKYHTTYGKVIDQLNTLFSPIIVVN